MVGEGSFFSGRKSRLSQLIANTKMFTIDTSTVLGTLPKKPGMPVIPTTTGGVFVQDKPAFVSTVDGVTFVPFGLKKHYHDVDADDNGGLWTEMVIRNSGLMIPWYNYSYSLSDFFEEKTGTGAGAVLVTTSTTAALDIIAGTSANGYDNLRTNGGQYRLNEQSALEMKIQYNGAGLFTNYIWRAGVNAEMINLVNDTTAVSYGIEACPADAKALVFSCDGAGARSTLPTVFNNDETAHIWALKHEPSTPRIRVTRDTDFTPTNVTDKTTEVPIAGTTATGKMFSMGVKSTVSSASKKITYRGATFIGVPEGTWKWQVTEFPP
jgi:hypothetical protein